MAGRRKGRILAFQALYAWDVSRLSLETLLDFGWIEEDKRERLGEEGIAFPRLLIAGTIEHIAEIDSEIKANLTNWDFDRLNKVDLAILRMSVYSLLFQKDLHSSIVIDEAIDISKEFGSEESFKFINAVLDSIRKKHQEGEVK
jgi:transcription antitermination protein NusB